MLYQQVRQDFCPAPGAPQALPRLSLPTGKGFPPGMSHTPRTRRPPRRLTAQLPPGERPAIPAGLRPHSLEEVALPGLRERHLPARRQRPLVRDIAGALPEVPVLRRRARAGQRGGRGVRADVHGRQARRGPARIRARLPRVRARVGFPEEGLGQDLLPPGAGPGVHHRVEERLQLRVQVLRDVDYLLPRRRGRGRGVHCPPVWPDGGRSRPGAGGDRGRPRCRAAAEDVPSGASGPAGSGAGEAGGRCL